MPRMQETDILNNAGLVSHIDNLVREHPDFEVLCDPCVSGYCFRYLPNGLVEPQDRQIQMLLDHVNGEIVEAVQHEGFTFLAKTRVCGCVAMRMSIESHRILLEDVDKLFEAIARWGRTLKNDLLIRRNTTPDMEGEQCLNESHSSSTVLSVI